MDADEIKAAINAFFSDTSRSQEETLEGLESILEEVESGIAAIRDDMKAGRR